MFRLTQLNFIAIILLFGCGGATVNQPIKLEDNTKTAFDGTSIGIKEIATGLNSPIGLIDPNDSSNRLFIAEQGGKIRVLENGKLISKPLLNLKSKIVAINSFYDERGLLGFCISPNFKTDGKFYVYYSAPSAIKNSNHKSVLASYTISENRNIANADEKIILEIEEPESNHNGGQLAFGLDGFLYIAVGDGGGAGDEHGEIGNAQNLKTHLGKILRIDVSKNPYGIPLDNPIKNGIGKPEIFAFGLRNPWRFSFDKITGKLFCADVGQNEYEEINIIENGGNYGWRIMEGLHCFNPSDNCKKDGLILPIFEYPHSVGLSITGGFVYRGTSMAPFYGKYIYADWTGPLFCLSKTNGKWNSEQIKIINAPDDMRILSFAEDAKSEIYILTSKEVTPKSFTGSIYKLIAP